METSERGGTWTRIPVLYDTQLRCEADALAFEQVCDPRDNMRVRCAPFAGMIDSTWIIA